MKRRLSAVATILALGYLAYCAALPRDGAFLLSDFGRLPALQNGRVKPIDTIARVSLLMIRGKQTIPAEGRSVSAVEWLLDVMASPEKADELKAFVINDPDVLSLMGKEQSPDRYYSFSELKPSLKAIDEQYQQAERIESRQRNRFQSAVVNLAERLTLYDRLKYTLEISQVDDFPGEIEAYGHAVVPGVRAAVAHQAKGKFDRNALGMLAQFFERYQLMDKMAEFRPLPPLEGEPPEAWSSVGTSLLELMRGKPLHPGALPLAEMMKTYRAGDAEGFNRAVSGYSQWLDVRVPRAMSFARAEFRFNAFEPFFQGMILYLCVFLLVVGSWLVWPETLGRTAFRLLLVALAVHTAGLVARIILQGRPPVTNLYSSAIFVGWMAAVLGTFLESRTRKGFGSLVASFIGFTTLIIAHHLAEQGDTMEMMRAVLDSNFWLSTHVVAITIGYSSTFLAGTLAHVYILRGLLSSSLQKDQARTLTKMTYGVVCFSLLFSFTGTVLGGIWADQSWGRFWGWDPKENGALIIVLWNAIILHARWGGFIRERGLMVCAVFGNVVTALSWFGVNMLGIGLHSYGWMDKAFYWLAFFVATQLAVMGLALLPSRYWRSRAHGVPIPA